MGPSWIICLPVVRCMGLIILLTGTQQYTCVATTITGIPLTTDVPLTTYTNDVTTETTPSTEVISTTTPTTTTPPPTTPPPTTPTTTPTTTAPETTSNPNQFLINLNTSCVTGQLKVNGSHFNDTQGTIDINGTCDGDTQYISDFINQLTKGQTITTTTNATTTTSTTTATTSVPSTTITSTDGDTESPTSTRENSCTKQQWTGIGIGAGAVAAPCVVILLLCVFRHRICSSCRRHKKTGDKDGTGSIETDASRQRPRANMNPYTSTCVDSLEAETDVSRPGYGNTGFQGSSFEGIPALPRKTSIFTLHEDDDTNMGNSFTGFGVPETNPVPESDYDQLPIGRKPLETTAYGTAEDEEEYQTDYVNVLEARGGHEETEQEEYINYPAISC